VLISTDWRRYYIFSIRNKGTPFAATIENLYMHEMAQTVSRDNKVVKKKYTRSF